MEKKREKVIDEQCEKEKGRETEGDIMWRKGDGTSGERGKGEEEKKERQQ